MRGVFLKDFDGLLLCVGGVASGSIDVLVPLQDLFGLVVDFCTVLSYSILTMLITDSFSYCNVLIRGTLEELIANFGPFCRRDCSPSVSGLLDRFMTHFFLMCSGVGVFLYCGESCSCLKFLICQCFACLKDMVNAINKSREIIFKQAKHQQIKNF